jgi:hypothetical protein
MHEQPRRRWSVEPRHCLLAVLSLGLLGMAACTPSPGKFGDPCNLYVASSSPDAGPGTTDCAKNLSCACRQSGCFCVPFCDVSDGGSSCPGTSVCVQGRNPAENSSGYYCFPAQDADGGH